MTDTHEEHPEDRRLLDAVYKGDKKREEAANKRSLSLAVGWSDIMAHVTVYPQHEQRARDAIDRLLGYLPPSATTMPHEVFIRTLIEQHDTGMITDDDYAHGLVTHVTHIRNDDVNKFFWVADRNPTREEYRQYSNMLTDYKNRVSHKIEKFFGEVPDLVHSLQAEMMLRDLMHQHSWANIPELTPFDYRAFTIIAYRKAYLTSGPHAANQSPLLGRKS